MQVLFAIVTKAASPWHPRDCRRRKAAPRQISSTRFPGDTALVWRGHQGRMGWQLGRELQ